MKEVEKQLVYFKNLTEKFTNKDKLKEIEAKQLSKIILGCRIRCDYMHDIDDSTGKIDEAARQMVGICGTVESVDDACQLHVKWDNGSTLILNPDIDEFTLLEEE